MGSLTSGDDQMCMTPCSAGLVLPVESISLLSSCLIGLFLTGQSQHLCDSTLNDLTFFHASKMI